MNEKKELLKNHFNTLKSKLIDLLKVTSKFMMSNSAFRQNASHRTQQRKSVGTAEFLEKLSNVAKIHDSAKLFLKDAVLIGHSQETDGFKVVNQYRKTVDEQFSPIVEQYTKEIVEAQQEGETVSDAVKDGILQLLIDVNGEFVQNMKHLRDGIVTLRKEVTQTIASKDLPQKLADAKVQKRLEVIKTTPPSPKPEKRQKKKVVVKEEDDDNDNDNVDEDDESGEDLGDEDSLVTNEDDENEVDDEQPEEEQAVVTKKKRKNQEKTKKVKQPEPLADDADAETSSSADDVEPPPKKKTRQQTDDPDKIAVQKLQDEQTIADANYQKDYEKRQRKIDALRDKIRRKARQQRIAQSNKAKGYADASVSSDDKVEEENGVEGSGDESDASDEDFDVKEEQENRKKKKLLKKVQEDDDDEQAVAEPADDVPVDAMQDEQQDEQQEVAEQPAEEAAPNEEDF